jgi:multiple sugar transport system ATP-binding protein
MARLELHEACKGFDRPILDRLSLTVEEGEFFVVVGPSGIGKTTLLRCIAGLEVLDAGRVIIGGKDVTRVPPYRRNAAMTFESYALYPHMTVFENIASPLRARRVDEVSVRKAVMDVARLLRIEQLLDRRPHEVSGGQKQRTALGRTLVAKPDVFLLDEPISHLDAKIRHELRRQFHTLQELRRVATVYVTHDYAEALSLGDRIGVMGDGGLVQVGTSREVFERPSTIFVARHLGQPSINEVPCRLSDDGGELRLSGRRAPAGDAAECLEGRSGRHTAAARSCGKRRRSRTARRGPRRSFRGPGRDRGSDRRDRWRDADRADLAG